jgi:hypothetical protein
MVKRSVVTLVLSHLICALVAFQLGLFVSYSECASYSQYLPSPSYYTRNRREPKEEKEEEEETLLPLEETVVNSTLFPSSMTWLFTGLSSIQRTEFAPEFPLGTIVHANNNGPKENQKVLVLHNSWNRPRSSKNAAQDISFEYTLKDSLANCSTVTTVYNSLTWQNQKSCTAIVADRESLDVLQWVRPRDNATVLPRGGRYDKFQGDYAYSSATPDKFANQSILELKEYLAILDDALWQLKPIAEKVANAGISPKGKGNSVTKRTIVVLSCNYGHADLLVNYACAASKVGADISKFLVFATDGETFDLANALGFAAFYDEALFRSVPNEEANMFGDSSFARITMTKIYVAHLLSSLGYNFLLQDVDIVLKRKDYIEYFVNKTEEEQYDMYLQDDFTPRLEYLPWYVRLR